MLKHNTVAVSLRQIGWLPFALTSLILIVVLLPQIDIFPDRARIVELVIPLAAAVHAALILSPDDEPGLELQLACRRPLQWLLIERVALVLAGYSMLALAAMAFSGAAIMRWLPTMLLLSGLAIYLTLNARTPAFSIAMVVVLGTLMDLFRDELVPGAPILDALAWLQPSMWVIHLYLPADSVAWYDYRTNRTVIFLLAALLMLLAVRFTQSGDRMLLGSKPVRRRNPSNLNADRSQ